MGSISVACYNRAQVVKRNCLSWCKIICCRCTQRGWSQTERRLQCARLTEVFEWVSREAIEGAHKNPVVIDLWKKFESVYWYETPANLKEFQNMFSHFEPL